MGLLKWLDQRFEETAMMVMLAILSAIMGYSVVMRYVFNDSLSWAEEICRYLFVWSAFLSASLCLKRRSSIKIDMLLLALPPNMQRFMILVGDLVMLAFFSYMLYGAWGVTTGMYESGQTSPAIELPMYYVYVATIVGFGLCIVRLLQRIFFIVSKPKITYQEHLDAGKGETPSC